MILSGPSLNGGRTRYGFSNPPGLLKECRVYLTFLVDPDTNIQGRKKGEGVWAVKASLTRPKQWTSEEGEISLTLGHGWQERLPGFLEQVAALRNQQQQNVAAPVDT